VAPGAASATPGLQSCTPRLHLPCKDRAGTNTHPPHRPTTGAPALRAVRKQKETPQNTAFQVKYFYYQNYYISCESSNVTAWCKNSTRVRSYSPHLSKSFPGSLPPAPPLRPKVPEPPGRAPPAPSRHLARQSPPAPCCSEHGRGGCTPRAKPSEVYTYFIQYTDTQLRGDKFHPNTLTARQCEEVTLCFNILKVSPRLNKHLISTVN